MVASDRAIGVGSDEGMKDMTADIDIMTGTATERSTDRNSRRRRWPVLLAVLAAAGLASIVAVRAVTAENPAPPAPAAPAVVVEPIGATEPDWCIEHRPC
jgi:hypothetical protein